MQRGGIGLCTAPAFIRHQLCSEATRFSLVPARSPHPTRGAAKSRSPTVAHHMRINCAPRTSTAGQIGEWRGAATELGGVAPGCRSSLALGFAGAAATALLSAGPHWAGLLETAAAVVVLAVDARRRCGIEVEGSRDRQAFLRRLLLLLLPRCRRTVHRCQKRTGDVQRGKEGNKLERLACIHTQCGVTTGLARLSDGCVDLQRRADAPSAVSVPFWFSPVAHIHAKRAQSHITRRWNSREPQQDEQQARQHHSSAREHS